MTSSDLLPTYQSIIYTWIHLLLNYLASISILLSSLSISVSIYWSTIYLFVHLYSLIWYREIKPIYNQNSIQVYSIQLNSILCMIFDAMLRHSIPFIVFHFFLYPILELKLAACRTAAQPYNHKHARKSCWSSRVQRVWKRLPSLYINERVKWRCWLLRPFFIYSKSSQQGAEPEICCKRSQRKGEARVCRCCTCCLGCQIWTIDPSGEGLIRVTQLHINYFTMLLDDWLLNLGGCVWKTEKYHSVYAPKW